MICCRFIALGLILSLVAKAREQTLLSPSELHSLRTTTLPPPGGRVPTSSESSNKPSHKILLKGKSEGLHLQSRGKSGDAPPLPLQYIGDQSLANSETVSVNSSLGIETYYESDLVDLASEVLHSLSEPQNSEYGKELEEPQLTLCLRRLKGYVSTLRSLANDHRYIVSTENYKYLKFNSNSALKINGTFAWLEARNECRRQCMDLVGLETEAEHRLVQNYMSARGIKAVWTAGRLCDGHSCQIQEDMQPMSVNGWVWTSNNLRIHPTNEIPSNWNVQPWSLSGPIGHSQPDNSEGFRSGTNENCLAIVRSTDGLKWHDLPCAVSLPFMCEDSDDLLEFVENV